MTQPVFRQIARNGFDALPDAKKRWFLIHVQALTRLPAEKRPVPHTLSAV